MTNLAGHDMEAVLEAFHSVADDTPQCFIAYTIKGHGTPLAGHRDNHAGLMNLEQMDVFRSKMQIPEGSEWSAYDNLLIEPETAKNSAYKPHLIRDHLRKMNPKNNNSR